MNETTFINRVRAGAVLAVGEYRHSKAEMIAWRDKQTGRAMTAPVLRHTVELGDQSVAVSERVPDSITKLEDLPPVPFKKGQMVVLHVEELTRNLGQFSARGKLEPFETNGSGEPSSPAGSGPLSGKGAESRKP